SATRCPDGLDPKSSVRPLNQRLLTDPGPATTVVCCPEPCDSRRTRRDDCMFWSLIRRSDDPCDEPLKYQCRATKWPQKSRYLAVRGRQADRLRTFVALGADFCPGVR